MRLQKFLSRAGAASRRKAEELMLQGRVRVNGERAVSPGVRIDPERDIVEVDGREVSLGPRRWILFHKPAGCLTTRDDPHGRTTVYDLLPDRFRGLRYVGRLDQDTEGLLLLTNEGGVSHRLLHPSSQVEREYEVEVEGRVEDAVLDRLGTGVELEDGPARARRVRRLEPGREGSRLALVLTEGRKREVRRMLDAVGHPVRRLRRVRFGPVELGGLEVSRWRELTRGEVEALRTRVGGSG